jgi:hypothetical protein
MMEAQFDTGATHDTRIFTGWAPAGGAPSKASAMNPTRKLIGLRIVSSPILRLVAMSLDVGTGSEPCQLQSHGRSPVHAPEKQRLAASAPAAEVESSRHEPDVLIAL